MKKFFLVIVLLMLYSTLRAQTVYFDKLTNNPVWENAPANVSSRKAFMRERHFYEQRAYPNFDIPDGAYQKAIEQRNIKRANSQNNYDITWTSIGPTSGNYPGWGNISSRIVTGSYHPTDPNIIYIGAANGGVWKSTNGGTTFLPKSDFEVSLSSGSLVIDKSNPNIIYFGTGEATYSGASYYGSGVLKSTNGGDSWFSATSGIPTRTYCSKLAISPKNNQRLFAAYSSAGLYKTTNGGLSWTLAISGKYEDVTFTPSGDTVYAISPTGLLKISTNQGENFVSFGTGVPTCERVHLDLCYSQPKVMYLASYNNSAVNVYKSIDGGANWAQIGISTNFDGGQAWYDLYCKVNPNNPNIAFIGTIDVYRTTNGGTSFTNITNGYYGGTVHVDQHNLFFNPLNPNELFSCNDGGINKSTNNGTSFTNMNTSMTLTQFYRIAASPFTPARILGGTQDNGTQQTFGAINWISAFGGDGGEVCFNPFDQNFIIGESQYGGLVRTTNGGTSWNSARTGIDINDDVTWVAPIVHHPTISGTFYTARTYIYKSTNNGGNWTAISGQINGNSAIREIAISKSNPNVFLCSISNLIFRSTDGGVTWTNISTGLPAKVVTSLAVHPSNSNIVFATFSGFGSNKVYRSTNMGSNWTSINGDLPDSPCNDILIFPDDPDNTYFVANDVGVFLTRNGGVSYSEISLTIPNTVIIHLDYSPSVKKLRAGTHGRGVYEAVINFEQSVTTNVNLQSGWNLLAVPLLANDMSKNSLFPTATSAAFYYLNGYFQQDTLKKGNGYWIKFANAQAQSITGLLSTTINIPVIIGWNLIGGLNTSVPISSITTNPPNIISTYFFEYLNGYQTATNIEPGKGYWVRVNSNGVIIINSAIK